MESKSWTGDDDREFGIDPDEESCEDCGAGPLEDCAWYCQCLACETGRAVLKETRA
jgi:hypothetical protein